MSQGAPGGARRSRGLVPIVGWIRSYDRSWLRGDLIAGVTVAALIVPKNLGYAGIAGVPLQNGLYAAAAGAIIYAIFGTSRQLSVGPSSGLAAVAASAVLAAGLTGEHDVASFVAGITLASGVLYLLLAVLRMGWIAQFLSRAVVTGFLFGAAIDVVIGELPKLTGTKASGSNSFQELWSWLGGLDQIHPATAWVGALSLLVVFGLRRIAPGVPGALVLVVGGLLASWLFDLSERGVALVGAVPRGLPSFELPDLKLMWDRRRHRGRGGGRAGPDRVLPDRRGCANVRRQAPLSDRHQPGVAGPGHGQYRSRPAPRDARLDQPFRKFVERPLRCSVGRGLADVRRHGSSDVALPGAPLLQPAQAGAGGLDHRGGRDGNDERPRDAPAGSGPAIRFLDRHRGDSRHLALRRSRRCGDRDRAVPDLADLGRHPPQDADPGARARYPGLPRMGRPPRRRTGSRGGGTSRRRGSVLCHLRRFGGSNSRGDPLDPGPDRHRAGLRRHRLHRLAGLGEAR